MSSGIWFLLILFLWVTVFILACHNKRLKDLEVRPDRIAASLGQLDALELRLTSVEVRNHKHDLIHIEPPQGIA